MTEQQIQSLDALLTALEVEGVFGLEAVVDAACEMYASVEITPTSLTVEVEGGCCTELIYPFTMEAFWKALHDLDEWSQEDLLAQGDP